jgi:hypothetical protein
LKQESGRWLPQRGAYEFGLQALEDCSLQLDLGAGRSARLHKLQQQRAPLPADLPGEFVCSDVASRWCIEADGRLWVDGPIVRTQQAWRLRGLGMDWVELQCPGYWITPSLLLKLERDAAGRVMALRVDGARVKGLRFLRKED